MIDVCQFFSKWRVDQWLDQMEINDIKIQHNVVRFPEKMKMQLLEKSWRGITCPSRPILTGLFSFHELNKWRV